MVLVWCRKRVAEPDSRVRGAECPHRSQVARSTAPQEGVEISHQEAHTHSARFHWLCGCAASLTTVLMEAHTEANMLFHWGLAAAQRALPRPLTRGGRTPAALASCSRHLARAQLAHATPASMLSRDAATEQEHFRHTGAMSRQVFSASPTADSSSHPRSRPCALREHTQRDVSCCACG